MQTLGLMLLMFGAGLLEGNESIRLRMAGGRPVVDGVFLNGHGPYRFLLDTGGQTNQIGEELARRLKLRPAYRVELESVTGVKLVHGGRVESVTLGSMKATNLEFLFTGLEGVRIVAPDADGVLGQEFLARFDYTLDFRSRLLRVSDAPGGGDRLPFQLIAGRMAIATDLGELVLDSGTDTLILFGEGKNTRNVQIGRRSYRAQNPVRIAGRPGGANGLLPASLFRSIFISNSQGYVVLD